MAFSKLLQCDAASVTPDKAIAAIMAEINRLQNNEGLSLSSAWQQIKTLEPELFSRVSLAESSAALPNEDEMTGVPKFDASPANKPFIARALCLPADVDDSLLKAAWLANCGQTASFNPQRVFLGVQGFIMQTEGLDVIAARSEMMDKFKALCEAAGQMPVIQKGAKEGSGSGIFSAV